MGLIMSIIIKNMPFSVLRHPSVDMIMVKNVFILFIVVDFPY